MIEDNWEKIWLEAWLECCDKSLANFVLTVEFGEVKDARVFLGQFKRAKQCAIENMRDRNVGTTCCNVTPHKHGKDRQGYQRYKCPICHRTFSDNPSPGKPGRKPIGDKPMSAAERKRKQRAKKQDGEGL